MAWDSVSWISLLVGAYLIGSLPSAYIVGRVIKGYDIRELGDRNAGAANAYHNLGSKAGVAVGTLDMAKGAVAVFLARGIASGIGAEMTAGLAAVAGHNWPFYLQFKGGRGAATALGILMALVPVAAIPMSLGALVLLIFARSAMVALSFAFIPLPLLAWFTGTSLAVVAYCIGLPTMVGLSHLISVRRLKTLDDQQKPLPVPLPQRQDR